MSTEETVNNPSVEEPANTSEEILKALKSSAPKTRRELETLLGHDSTAVRKAIKDLRKKGLLYAVGVKRGTRYCVTQNA